MSGPQLRKETIQDYAGLARRGRVTRARMKQIMKLLDLPPDIQEQILFLPRIQGLNERNLRPLASRIDWAEQRRMFEKITGRVVGLDRERTVRGNTTQVEPSVGASAIKLTRAPGP